LPKYTIVKNLSVGQPLSQRNAWQPKTNLPTGRSSHPIEVSLTELDLLKIKIFARQDSNRKLAYITNNHLTHITTESLQELLSHGEMIIDNILNVFLEILCSSQGIYYLSTYFVSMLRLERNWARSKRWFARSLQHKKVHKPLMTSPVILIPCHVNGNHWVALVRRIIDGKVYFYYADDLNNPVTEKNIKELLQTTTDQSFFPADARWITCKSTTFRPHSNECGPRSLLALTVLGLHPHPHTDMLRPYMHANLAQILRTWVASTIITGHIKLPANIAIPFTNLNNGNSSFPQSLILWNESEQSLVQPGLPKSKNHEYQPTGTLSLIGSSQEDKPLQPLPTTNSSIPPDHQQQKKYIRWKRQHHKHQTSIRKFIVSHQPTIYDFKFFKPQKKVTKEDPEVWGHVMERIDPNETLRVVLQNPNGISPHFSFSDFLFSLHVCENIGVGVLAMPETNLDWKPSQIASTKRCFKRNWQHSSMQYSHSAEEFDNSYKPGGTLTAVMGSWSSRVMEKGVDPYEMGRWSYIVLRGKNSAKVYMVTVYRVCDNKDSGPKTSYRQQFRRLSANFRAQNTPGQPDPHRQCILDLQAWLETITAQGHAIILSLDSNEDISEKEGSFHPLRYIEGKHPISKTHNGSLATLATTCGLIDPLASHHKDRPFPATYNRGQSRLDYILVSSSILPSVQRSGILPYQSIFYSDHRACFLDIDSIQLFGDSTTSMAPPCRRQLQLQDPGIVEKYNEVLQKQLAYHKVQDKIKVLQQALPNWTKQHQDSYEKLDRIITEAMRHAEKQSCKKYTSKFAWSPTLVQAVQQERYWKLILKQRKGTSIAPATLLRAGKAAGILKDPTTHTLDNVIIALREIKKQRKELQRKHLELRESYLERLSKSVVLKASPSLEDPKNEQKLKRRIKEAANRILKKERKRNMYRTIGLCLTPTSDNTSGISRVDVPLPPEGVPLEGIDPKSWKGPWRAVTDPKEIGFYISQANLKQYNQAAPTPFGSGYLPDTLGNVLSSKEAEDLLHGSLQIDLERIPLSETTAILEFLAHPYSQVIHPYDPVITPDQFKATYSIVQEKTSSSYSGRHVGHYKAVLHNEYLVNIHAAMMSIPYQAGFAPKRWHQVVDVMLEKDPGQPRQHRLRIVALLESDYNQSQRILLARPLSHHMEDAGMLPEMQYGSRPSKLCVSPVINKVLSYDLVRQTKVCGAFIENDAVGCYDRLVNSIVFLELRHIGIPVSILKAIQDAWNHAVHHIKTIFGTSTGTYRNTEAHPLFGPGQGSTTGPILWGILFCIIEKNLPKNTLQMFFKAVNDAIQVRHKGDAFVDDAQLGCTSNLPSGLSFPTTRADLDAVLQSLQQMAQSWERLLFTTGGALNLQKSFWVLVSWEWKNGVARMSTIQQTPGELQLTAGYNTSPVSVPRISPYEGFRTLGVYISPSGSTKVARKKLTDISLSYATAISGGRLNRGAALWSYLLYLIPKLTYSVPALTMSEEECKEIQSPSIMAVLPRLHVNRNTARSIIFGPAQYGGLGLPTVYSEQSLGQLIYFVGHVNLGDKTGNLILISLSYLQLLSGSATPILQREYKQYQQWVENSWLTSLWAFLSKVKYKVVVHQEWLPSKPRANDISLMDQFMALGYKANQLLSLNRCRLYLQVIYLSDLVSADGKLIIPDCKRGIRLRDRVSSLNWPIQAKPPQSAWTLWQQALAHFEHRDKLLIPLKNWTGETHQRWRWFAEPGSQDIYNIDEQNIWRRIRPAVTQPGRLTRQSTTALYDISTGTVTSSPSNASIPITLLSSRIRDRHTVARGPSLFKSTATNSLPTFLTTIYSRPLPEIIQELTNGVETAKAYGTIATHETPDVIAYSWSVRTSEPYYTDGGILAGRYNSSSDSSLLVGLLALLHFWNEAPHNAEVLYLRLPKKSMIQILVNESPTGVMDMVQKDHDLIADIKAILAKLKESKPVRLLLPDASHDPNMEANLSLVQAAAAEKAKKIADQPDLGASAQGTTLSAKVRLYRNKELVVGDFRSLLRADLYRDQLRETIEKKERWSVRVFDLVEWDAFSKAFSKLPRVRRISYSKLTHKLLQTNSRNNLFYGSTAVCPCCNNQEETQQHIISCPSPQMEKARAHYIDIYKKSLEDVGTPAKLIQAFTQGIREWIINQTTTRQFPSSTSLFLDGKHPLQAAYLEQTNPIGWDQFLRGRLSRRWGDAYGEQFPDSTKAEQLLWLSDVVRINMDFYLAMWESRNAVVHGQDQDEVRRKQLHQLKMEVTQEYRRYHKDPFIISREQSRLFDSRTMHQRLLQDRDTLKCWLADVQEAKQVQIEQRRKAAEAAKHFFEPRRTVQQSTFVIQVPSEYKCTQLSNKPSYQAGSVKNEAREVDIAIHNDSWSADDSITTVTYTSLEGGSLSDRE